ncbi:hypothetical protein MO867_20870 [Microbulbifer sp. OS29]|uniref:Lipoprotein n=1 Tax=Microbulbifer okhotskensis TaxID=2926617 RepID=A0A9X2EQV0_9GAMM|nr:hypothetical protein [Microbulbifer okhotskensis]MCO1336784.1 hypothetical protein [Microbulbifer okhotskensis]
MNRFLVIAASMVIASCASNSGIANIQNKGNLEASKPAECVNIDQLKSNQNPADIFVGMKKCWDSESYSTAADMYYAAMTYGIYDNKRVSDKTSHQGIIVLQMQTLSGLSGQQVSLLQTEVNAILENNANVCSALTTRGLPTYHPTYMIQLGIGAFTGNNPNNDLVENFDRQSAWAEAIDITVKCKQS